MKILKDLLVAFLGGIAIIYLINPSAGLIELIPDNLPLIGNLDEAGAAALAFSALNYFGINLSNLFGKSKKEPNASDSRQTVSSKWVNK